jgi:hypothetical protein
MAEIKWLKKFGSAGNFISTLVTLVTANWGIALSAAAAVAAVVWTQLTSIVENQRVQIGIGVFLAVLWTIVGITALIDRKRPRKVQTHHDYRYGLTFEGISPNFTPPSSGLPNAGGIGFAIRTQKF